jgi:hypothetical protein
MEGETVAVKIMHKNEFETLEIFDVPKTKIDNLKNLGVALKMGVKEVTLVVPNGGPEISTAINPGALTLAMKGALGDTSKAVISKALTEAVDKAISHAAADALLAEVTTQAEEDDTPKMEVPGVVSDFDMTEMTPVKLAHATSMYQPVLGTSDSSRYHVVALSDELKVAARVKGTQVSIRVEGNIASHAKTLEAIGLTINGTTHASIHGDGGDHVMVCKMVGAVIAVLPVDVQTPVPNVARLIGKGQ